MNREFTEVSAIQHRCADSSAKLKSRKQEYAQGETTMDLLLDAARRNTQDELDLHAAAASFAVAVKDVHLQKGSLLRERNITIVDLAEAR
jgi:hypothetical protein